MMTYFILSFPTACLVWDLGLNLPVPEYLPTYFVGEGWQFTGPRCIDTIRNFHNHLAVSRFIGKIFCLKETECAQ